MSPLEARRVEAGTVEAVVEPFPAQRGGAKALLLTVLGEFVLPMGGQVWTSSLVAAADALGIAEKNARQAIARIGDRGLIESTRHGRHVQWSLTKAGRDLLESGTARIYGFGLHDDDWAGEWLVVHCPVAEAHRSVRTQLRTRLSFMGFGELSPSLLISPHVERHDLPNQVLAELELADDCIVLRSKAGSTVEDAAMVQRAWDLDELASSYDEFCSTYAARQADGGEECFRAVAELVHDWRRFPFVDPELPSSLLPDSWAGTGAAKTFHDRHAAWSSAARLWFRDIESANP